MLIGFVLILTSASAEPMPVSERIYPNKTSCERIKKRLLERQPMAQLECTEVLN